MKLLVAGIGNIFFGDDGFGPEVARVLAADRLPGVKIEDYGIRGLHLAYEMLAGYDRVFLVDAVPRGGLPGTLYVIEPDSTASTAVPDAHRMDLENVFAFLRVIGGEPPPVTLVGCEPSAIDETLGLSQAVRDAVAPAADLVRRLLNEALAARQRGEKESMAWSEA
ncbi:MAG TPA: hydrogenase maturation protease [Candidatus Dormibacteraeota bacterium]|nr:hydrogenase maturation protease [Candidatus Dormibacteraeota bacterium]